MILNRFKPHLLLQFLIIKKTSQNSDNFGNNKLLEAMARLQIKLSDVKTIAV